MQLGMKKTAVADAQSATVGIYCKIVKRPLDLLIALLSLIVLSPILLLTAILVRIKLGSPVIFQQQRPGKEERIFTIYKFRTMTEERDEKGELLPDKLRLTKFGTFLRSTSIDELPELWNIVCGDMAIVGPRPLAVEYLAYYNEAEKHRHDVLPGLTGLAQIHGRNFATWEERFSCDVQYARNITFWGDLKIIARTAQIVLKRESFLIPGTGTVEDFNIHRARQITKGC